MSMKSMGGGVAVTFLAVSAAAVVASPAYASSVLSAGDMVRIGLVEYGCTVGMTGHGRAGEPIAVTAGHCSPKSLGALAYRGFGTDPVGSTSVVTGMDDLDLTAIRVSGPVADSRVAAPGSVGDIVCKVGRVTGRSCGPIVSVSGTEVVADVRTLPGDSGGPLRDRSGAVVGITSRLTSPAGGASAAAAAQVWARALTGPVDTTFTRADRIARRIGL